MTTMTHIDDWLDDPKNREAHPLAHKFFEAFRRLASAKLGTPYAGKLFCTWRGKHWRVVGCSRLGDVWLVSDLTKEHGYEHRVDVAECSDWCDDLI